LIFVHPHRKWQHLNEEVVSHINLIYHRFVGTVGLFSVVQRLLKLGFIGLPCAKYRVYLWRLTVATTVFRFFAWAMLQSDSLNGMSIVFHSVQGRILILISEAATHRSWDSLRLIFNAFLLPYFRGGWASV